MPATRPQAAMHARIASSVRTVILRGATKTCTTQKHSGSMDIGVSLQIRFVLPNSANFTRESVPMMFYQYMKGIDSSLCGEPLIHTG